MNERINIAGVGFDPVTYDQVLEAIGKNIAADQKMHITTPNPEMVLYANEDEAFREILTTSHLVIPDGTGILWASYYLSQPLPKTKLGQWTQLYTSLASIIVRPRKIRKLLPDRVTGTDLFQKVVEASEVKAWKIFLLGAGPGVAKKAIKALKEKYPQAQLVGSYEGTPEIEDEEAIVELVNKAQPDILFVAYGSPAQEQWIHRNLFKLDSVKVAIGVGGAFDFVAGEVTRAPRLLRQFGLEWLWRFLKQPKRSDRIKNATHGFISLIVEEKKYQEE